MEVGRFMEEAPAHILDWQSKRDLPPERDRN
jgi:hypothetical protein